MKPFTLRLPSPAMAVASLALFVSLGGVGYAVANDNAQDKTVFTSLYNARVGSANVAFAKSASSSSNATTAPIVRKVAVVIRPPASGVVFTRLFTLDGLTITHICGAGGNQGLAAKTSVVGELKLVTVDEDTLAQFGVDKQDFTPFDGTLNLYNGLTDTENVTGRLFWQTASGHVVTFDYQDETGSFGGTNCTLGGFVTAG